MKLVKFSLEKIGSGEDTTEFLPSDTKIGQTVIIKKEHYPDYSGAFRVCEQDSYDSGDTIIVNQEDLLNE